MEGSRRNHYPFFTKEIRPLGWSIATNIAPKNQP
jgi:hypothetical protein